MLKNIIFFCAWSKLYFPLLFAKILIDIFATALVLVPTRELCLQVYEILQKFLHRFHWIVPGYVMGGESRSKEKARLRKGMIDDRVILFRNASIHLFSIILVF